MADLLGCLEGRDFSGALTCLRFTPRLFKDAQAQWRAFLHFHAGRHEEALEAYQALEAAAGGWGKSFDLHIAACLFRLRRWADAQQRAEQGPDCQLRVRLLLHCAAKLQGPGTDLSQLLEQLGSNVDDQLSLAALHYSRSSYQAAAAIYADLLAAHPDLHALHVYLALCHYMLDDWASCQEHLDAYRAVHLDSLLAANVWACNEFRERGPEAAAACLRALAADAQGSALLRHNGVVFGNGAGGMQVLPPLVGEVPEARLNLTVCYLRRGDAARALGLLRGMEPSTAFEHICKGVACALAAQQGGAAELALEAQHCFDVVGTSETECDTIPGRQCLASSLLLQGHARESLPYLESIAEFCGGDDAFSWNLGMARAAAGEYAGALEALAQVQRPDWAQQPGFVAWMARCHIMTGQPELAWQLYLQQQALGGGVAELLALLANDCYRAAAWLWAARAFDALEFLQQQGGGGGAVAGAEVAAAWEGKRGACVAVFQAVTAGEMEAEVLREVLILLHNSSNPQAEYIIRLVKKWVREAVAAVDTDV